MEEEEEGEGDGEKPSHEGRFKKPLRVTRRQADIF